MISFSRPCRHCFPDPDITDKNIERSDDRITKVSILKASTSPAHQLVGQGNGDVKTMDERFRGLSMALQLEQRRPPRALKQEKSVATRRRVLMRILGMKRFYKTLSLVREIKSMREKLVLQSSKSPGFTCAKKVIVCMVKFDKLPRSARDLLARTQLVAAIEQTEIGRLEKMCWGELIAQAQANLNAYREWMTISETRE